MIASHVAATLLAIFASPSAVVGDNPVGQGVASKTGYEYSDPPAIPSCGVEYGSVPNGVALRRSIIGDGSPPAMCGVCYRLTAAPELYDEATYQFQGNTAIGGWTQVVQVVDTAPNNNPVLSHGIELEYVFDLPDSIFDAASDVHPGAAGLPPSGHIPLMYEQIACDDTPPDTTTAATDPSDDTPDTTTAPTTAPTDHPSSTTTTTSTIITEDPDELTINRENRCGVSEVDAREHCKDTCVSNADCADGEYCWGVHANYCGSFPKRVYSSPEQGPWVLCGQGDTEEERRIWAQTFCGVPCTSDWTCSEPGQVCTALNENWCGSDYIEV